MPRARPACARSNGSRDDGLDARWQLVHATHALPGEIDAVAASGAGVVVCPSTEANLGDGLFDLPRWLAADVPLSLGSDSHATRDWREELRLLEYGQRLSRRERNVGAAPEIGLPSTAERAVRTRRCRARAPRPDAPLGAWSPVRAPMRWSSMRTTTRSSASTRAARSTRSSSAARRPRGAT